MNKVTKKDLEQHVDYLNNKYCKNTKNKFKLSQGYGGYKISLTGKKYQRGNKTYWKKGSIGSGEANVIGYGYDTPKETLFNAYKSEAKGWLKHSLKSWEKRGR